MRIGSLDESGSDGCTTERPGGGRAAWWPTSDGSYCANWHGEIVRRQ